MTVDDLQARLRHRTLERRLLAGEHPRHDPLLARRAAQLVAPGARAALAATIERVVGEAAGEDVDGYVATPADGVRDVELELLALAARLRDRRPVSPAGILLVRRLLAEPVLRHDGVTAALQALDDGVA